MMDHNSRFDHCMITLLTQTFVEFSYLHFDTSFSSINQLSTFSTGLGKMTQPEKLQITDITPREIPKRLHYLPAIDPIDCVQIGARHSTLLIPSQCPVNQ